MPAAAIPKAKVLKDTRGLLKVLVDPQTNLIIGATLYVQEAQEIINMIVLAMRAKLPIKCFGTKSIPTQQLVKHLMIYLNNQ